MKGLLPFADSAEPLLSLGVHKHADLHKIRCRRDLKEILPLWLRLSALVPTDVQDAECLNKGSGKLLVTAYQKIQERKKQKFILRYLRYIWQAFPRISYLGFMIQNTRDS